MTMDTDPADVWVQSRDRLTYARDSVARLERDLAAARVRLGEAENAETEAWHKLNDARREIKAAEGTKR